MIWRNLLLLVIFQRENDNTIVKNVTDPINTKQERYLVWRFDIHVHSTKVSMHNVSTVKVVTNRRDLRQKHHYVLLLTLSSKNVLFERAIRTVGTRDLTNRWSRVMIFPMVTRRNSEKMQLLFRLSDNWLGCFTVHAHINFGGYTYWKTSLSRNRHNVEYINLCFGFQNCRRRSGLPLW